MIIPITVHVFFHETYHLQGGNFIAGIADYKGMTLKWQRLAYEIIGKSTVCSTSYSVYNKENTAPKANNAERISMS